MKKSLFTILSVIACFGINMSASLSMEEGITKTPDAFWNSLPGDFMSLGENLAKEIHAFQIQSVNNETIRAESKTEILIRSLVAKAPSLNPTIYGFCKFLENTRDAGGNNENINQFLLRIIHDSSFQRKILWDITGNSYASVYLNYLSPFSEYR